MKYTLLAAALLMAAPAYAADLDAMQTQMFGVSAQINGNCSGTLIWSDRDKESGEVTTLVLTAKHCISKPGREQRVDLPQYQSNRVVRYDSHVATVRARHFKHDVALLELKDKQTHFAQTAAIAPLNANLVFGEPVFVVGYPAGQRLTLTDGRFGGYETIDWPRDGVEYMRATPNIVGGNSGGGVYRVADGKYEIVAIVTGVITGMWHIGFHTPLDAIHEFLSLHAPEAIGLPPRVRFGGGR
jgi:S1-C subfamily serine protease